MFPHGSCKNIIRSTPTQSKNKRPVIVVHQTTVNNKLVFGYDGDVEYTVSG